MGDDDGGGVATLYKAKPPGWLSEVHKSADLGEYGFKAALVCLSGLGYLGFHPPHPDQEEDLLSEKFIKEGFSATSVPVSNIVPI
jgi:mediator of RNA polymerase II transcription subunit 12, fungi type